MFESQFNSANRLVEILHHLISITQKGHQHWSIEKKQRSLSYVSIL